MPKVLRVAVLPLAAAALAAVSAPLTAQSTGLRAQVEQYVAANQKAIVRELVELLSEMLRDGQARRDERD